MAFTLGHTQHLFIIWRSLRTCSIWLWYVDSEKTRVFVRQCSWPVDQQSTGQLQAEYAIQEGASLQHLAELSNPFWAAYAFCHTRSESEWILNISELSIGNFEALRFI
eukprot:259905-Chlamydomonas_euryale.AAC.2